MKISTLLKEINKHDWWVEETPAVHQTCEWAWHGFIESSKYFDKRFLTVALLFYRNDFLSEVSPSDEKMEQFQFALDKFKKDKNYLKKKKLAWQKVLAEMEKIGWWTVQNLKLLSRKELGEKYKKITDLWSEQARYSAFAECVDPFTEYELPKILENKLPNVPAEKLQTIGSVMSTPADLSFMEEERMDFFKSCLGAQKDKNNIPKNAQALEKKYIWMITHYGKAEPKTAEAFAREIRNYIAKKPTAEIKKELKQISGKKKRIKLQKKEIIKKYKLNKKLQTAFQLVSEFGEIIDIRKKYAMQGTFIVFRILEELEKRLQVPVRLLGYTTYKELTDWILKSKKIDTKILKGRQKFTLYLVTRTAPGKSKTEFITGRDVEKIYSSIFNSSAVKEFKGTVASANGKIFIGEVSLVLNTSHDKFKAGNILVTTMTRPDFLPLMRQAKAIITDEGGLTSHAAIIARELGIPCIIGTKIATRTLKNGNRVRMDMETGIIKILK